MSNVAKRLIHPDAAVTDFIPIIISLLNTPQYSYEDTFIAIVAFLTFMNVFVLMAEPPVCVCGVLPSHSRVIFRSRSVVFSLKCGIEQSRLLSEDLCPYVLVRDTL